MKILSSDFELRTQVLAPPFLLLLLIPLGVFLVLYPQLAALFSVLLALFFFVFSKIEFGFHLLIFFVPIGSLMVRSDFIEQYLPDKLSNVDHQNVYHIILLVFIISFLLRKSAGHLYTAPLAIKFKNGMLFFFILLAAWASFTMLWTPNKLHGAIHLSQLFINISLFYIAVIMIKDEKSLKRAMLAWISIGVAFAVAAVADRVYAESIEIISKKAFTYSWDLPITDNFRFSFSSLMNNLRAAGLSRFENVSNMINMTIPLVLYFMASSVASKKTQYLWLQLSCLLVLIFARALIPNKGGIGSFILSLSFLIVAFRPLRKKHLIFSFLLLITVTITAFLIANTIFQNSTGVLWLAKTATLAKESSASTRLDWWSEAARLVIKNTHLLGLGMGGFKYYISAPHAHSFVLSFLFDMGIIGLFCILSLMALIAVNFYGPVLRQETGLENIALFFAVSLSAFLIHGTFDFEYYMPEFWLFSGTSVAVLNLLSLEHIRKSALSNSESRLIK